jgi:ABC-type phosphate/phosphonate transport system substrate-binding protein
MIFICTGGSIAIAPVYYSQLFVHKESPYVSIQDLQDSIFAYNDESSLSGFHCMNFFLKTLNSQDESIRLPFFSGKATVI